jgi:DNA-directed RNA polymerase specialized sigma24 family protein
MKLGDLYQHLQKVPRHRDRNNAARTLGAIKKASAELNDLADKDLETDAHPTSTNANDVRPIIQKGTKELAEHCPPGWIRIEKTVLERRVKQLSERDRTILLHREQGKSYRQIAKHMGMPHAKSAADVLARIYAFLKDGGNCNGGNEDGGEPQLTDSSESQQHPVRAA